MVVAFTFFRHKRQTQSKNYQALNDLKPSIKLVNSKEKILINFKENQSQYLYIFTASHVTKTVKFHIHDITSPFKFSS